MAITFDLLENKRAHVLKYSDRMPDRKIIEEALYKAWKTTPSKNNAMPYQVHVWHKQEHKEAMHKLSVRNHNENRQHTKPKNNPYFLHIKTAPYLISVHGRVATPNKYFKTLIDNEGLYFDWADEKAMNRIKATTSLEVGMFFANLSLYLLEEGLDVSYNGCFKRDVKLWQEAELDVKYKPLAMMSIGYAESYRKDQINMLEEKFDLKPELKEIIKWID